jgi:hypothetical protein
MANWQTDPSLVHPAFHCQTVWKRRQIESTVSVYQWQQSVSTRQWQEEVMG